MKNLTIILTAVLTLSLSSQAFAFITVIDVQELAGKVTTIQPGSEYSLQYLGGKYLSYRGQASEAVNLFETLVHSEISEQLATIDADINEETGTVAITLAVSGYLGFQYYYYVLKQSSN